MSVLMAVVVMMRRMNFPTANVFIRTVRKVRAFRRKGAQVLHRCKSCLNNDMMGRILLKPHAPAIIPIEV